MKWIYLLSRTIYNLKNTTPDKTNCGALESAVVNYLLWTLGPALVSPTSLVSCTVLTAFHLRWSVFWFQDRFRWTNINLSEVIIWLHVIHYCQKLAKGASEPCLTSCLAIQLLQQPPQAQLIGVQQANRPNQLLITPLLEPGNNAAPPNSI